MQKLMFNIINKGLQVIIMFFPILIWDLFILLQCFISFPNHTFGVFSILCIFLLGFSILFGNSFLILKYHENEILECTLIIPDTNTCIYNMIKALPIALGLLFYAGIPVYIYGFLQFIYMLIDKEHQTFTEKIFTKKEKKSILA